MTLSDRSSCHHLFMLCKIPWHPFPACSRTSSRRVLRNGIALRWEGFYKGPYWVTHSWAEPEHVRGAKSPQRRVEKTYFLFLWQRNCEALMKSGVSSGRRRMFFGTLLPLQNASDCGPSWGESAVLCWCWQLLKYVWAWGLQEAVNLNGLALNNTTWPTLAHRMQKCVLVCGDADGIGWVYFRGHAHRPPTLHSLPALNDWIRQF